MEPGDGSFGRSGSTEKVFSSELFGFFAEAASETGRN